MVFWDILSPSNHFLNSLKSLWFKLPPYIVKSFFLENQGISNVSSINISEERAIEMDISLYLVRK